MAATSYCRRLHKKGVFNTPSAVHFLKKENGGFIVFPKAAA